MAKRRKSTKPIDRAAEYIDSPLMTQRLRNGREVTARIDGNYGVYRTLMRIGRATDGSCSCPSEGWPCKHLRALEATWKTNPASFLDLSKVLDDLASKSKTDLLMLIGNMVTIAPETLTACGVKGFEPEPLDDEFND